MLEASTDPSQDLALHDHWNLNDIDFGLVDFSKEELINSIQTADTALCSLIEARLSLLEFDAERRDLNRQIKILNYEVNNWNNPDWSKTELQLAGESSWLLHECEHNLTHRDIYVRKLEIDYPDAQRKDLLKNYRYLANRFEYLLEPLTELAHEKLVNVAKTKIQEICPLFKDVCGYLDLVYSLGLTNSATDKNPDTTLGLKSLKLYKSRRVKDLRRSSFSTRLQLDSDSCDIEAIEKRLFKSPLKKWQIESMTRKDGFVPLVIESKRGIHGNFAYFCHEHDLEIVNIGIDPDFQRQGLGSKFVEQLKVNLYQSCRDSIYARVPEANLGAQLFFKNSGFVVEKIEKNLHFDDQTRYLFKFKR